MLKRSHNCGELTKKYVGKEVILNGWISKRRDHGGLIFIDLRDRYGKTQIVFNQELNSKAYKSVFRLGLEDVIGVKGLVRLRPEEAINTKLNTGQIDIEVNSIEIFNEAAPMPFDVNSRESASEDHRLKYRYLELRTIEMQRNLKVRHDAAQITRDFLHQHNFIEIETPILMKSTPEGARDFLVPSRLHAGKFYALPQSPQTYKQLLMVSGLDKYFQIVKCFRDEDFRADRQPEFTQIDIEMSFIEQDDIIKIGTDLTRKLWLKTINVELPENFPIITYSDAMEEYGTDRPDTRFGLKLREFSEFVQKSSFNAFKTILNDNGRVKAIIAPNCASYSRKIIEELTDYIKRYHKAKGLAYMKCIDNDLQSGISKFFDPTLRKEIIKVLKVNENDMIFVVGDVEKIVFSSLSALRIEIANREKLIDPKIWKPLWVVDFPLVDWNADQNRFEALHHPFTSPNFNDIDKIESNPEEVRSLAYDIVVNGYEIGGGSIRIHSSDLQSKIFTLLGISKEEAQEKFGFLMEAFKYGAPPHGGMAFGFDRIVMLLTNCKQIRDVIAFPKTTSALSLMDDSPSNVSKIQLDELHLKLNR